MLQGWVWRELDQYTARICEIGVDGHALYNLEGTSASNCKCALLPARCMEGSAGQQHACDIHVPTQMMSWSRTSECSIAFTGSCSWML